MSNRGHKTQIVIAIIGLIGVLGGALFANWDKIFPKLNQFPEPKSSLETPAVKKTNQQKNIETEIVPVEKVIKAVGGWRQGGGDGEMDTNSKDYVPATATTELFVKDNYVKLNVEFRCEEYRGNHTTFSGKRTFVVREPPKGKNIVKVEAKGGLVHTFSGHTVGKNHGFNPFDGTDKTYWKNLSYRVDSSNPDDGPYVGVKGVLTCNIFLQNK